MDNDTHISDVHGSGSIGRDLRSPSADDGALTREDLEPRELLLEGPDAVVQLLQKYASVNVAKDPGDVFLMHLATRRDAWFVEIGQVGLCYLTVIQPGFSGTLNLIFWDRKLPQRRVPAVQAVLKTAAELFDLQRIAAFTPSNPVKVFLKHVGFTHEGTLRRSMFIDGAPVDAFALGLLRAEITWPHSMISSAQV